MYAATDATELALTDLAARAAIVVATSRDAAQSLADRSKIAVHVLPATSPTLPAHTNLIVGTSIVLETTFDAAVRCEIAVRPERTPIITAPELLAGAVHA